MGVRVSLAGEYRIVNPALFATESSDAFGSFYLELRHSLRRTVGEIGSHDFFNGQTQLTNRLRDLLLPKAEQLGLEMTQLDIYEAVPIGWLPEAR